MQSRDHGEPILHGRIVIPEPAWWDAESPFLYHGPIELWEHESRVESAGLRLGLRHAEWNGEQLIWNGKPVGLKSQTLSEFDEPTLQSLRERGWNSVIVPPGADQDRLADCRSHRTLCFFRRADRSGRISTSSAVPR